MRLVDRPAFKPMHCAAIPFIGQTNEGERWIDTGSEMPGFDNHVYLSETAVREAVRVLGLPTPDDYREVFDEREQLRAELAIALEENARLQETLSATETVEQYLDSLTAPEKK